MRIKFVQKIIDKIRKNIWDYPEQILEKFDHCTISHKDIDIFIKSIYKKNKFYKLSSILYLIFLASLLNLSYKLNKEYFLKYIEIYGLENIERFPHVSNYFVENSVEVNSLIEKSASIYKKVVELSQHNNLFDYIKDKSVAVVGNGPYEKGKAKGNEIDNHDIVVRFNNYVIENFEKDYGTKCDIWYLCCSDDIKIERAYQEKNIFWGYLENLIVPKEHIEAIYDNKDKLIGVLDLSMQKKLYKSLETFPSSGCTFINLILKLQPKQVDIYGFAGFSDTNDTLSTHYFEDREQKELVYRTSMHSLTKEKIYLNNLVNNYKFGGKNE